MKFFDRVLGLNDIQEIQKECGDYVKVTADLDNERIVVGCTLHADGEVQLLKKGGKGNAIWGGGIDFISKRITTSAVLNIRPRFNNDSMEILDSDRRNKFTNLVKKYFSKLWL